MTHLDNFVKYYIVNTESGYYIYSTRTFRGSIKFTSLEFGVGCDSEEYQPYHFFKSCRRFGIKLFFLKSVDIFDLLL